MCCIVKCCNCHVILAIDMAGTCGMPPRDWCVCVCSWKMANDIGMTIRKSIVVSFLPCWHSIPTCSFIFLIVFCNLFLLFFFGGGGGRGGENHGSLWLHSCSL